MSVGTEIKYGNDMVPDRPVEEHVSSVQGHMVEDPDFYQSTWDNFIFKVNMQARFIFKEKSVSQPI